jgi:hypothetical protein
MFFASPVRFVFDQPVEVQKMVKHHQGSPKLGQGPTPREFIGHVLLNVPLQLQKITYNKFVAT